MNLQKELAKCFYTQRDRRISIPDVTCADKHTELLTAYETFKNAGLEVIYRVHNFKYDDLALPKNVIAIPHENNDEHVNLEVKLGGKWYTVDATWPQELSIVKENGKSFSVNRWNNLTRNMITAVADPITWSPEKSYESMENDIESGEQYREGEEEANGKFYDAVNQFFTETKEEYVRWRHAPRRLFYYLDKSL